MTTAMCTARTAIMTMIITTTTIITVTRSPKTTKSDRKPLLYCAHDLGRGPINLRQNLCGSAAAPAWLDLVKTNHQVHLWKAAPAAFGNLE